ncbi:hypothetical protein ACIBG8_47115 [Nonomuraea sp. NPDC050556]|uniref:hypothetical protein n=1 Tax=Nonomuraea sp. NPDC050556 TaxID=3364369 RepID=UPI0037BA816D
MFNIKRALTATVLSTALAGGILGLGAIAAEASTNVSTNPCIWVGSGHKLKFHKGERVNKATIKYNFGGDYWMLKRTRGCQNVNVRTW